MISINLYNDIRQKSMNRDSREDSRDLCSRVIEKEKARVFLFFLCDFKAYLNGKFISFATFKI